MDSRPNKQIFVALGIVEHEGKFLILRRVSSNPEWHHRWNVPGGKAAPGETPENAVRREILEEAGLAVGPMQLLGIHTHHWQLPEHTQQTFLALYRAPALHTQVALREEENDAHAWVSLDEFYAMDNLLDGDVEMLHTLYEPVTCPKDDYALLDRKRITTTSTTLDACEGARFSQRNPVQHGRG